MAATYEAKTYAQAPVSFPYGNVTRVFKGAINDITSVTPAATDIIKLFKMPVGARVIDFGVFPYELLQANCDLKLEIHDGSSGYLLGNWQLDAATVPHGEASGVRVGMHKICDDNDWYIVATVSGAALEADHDLLITVTYTLDTPDAERTF